MARAHRGRRLDGDGDLRRPPARAVLRRLDDRVGERDRPRPRGAFHRLLARGTDRRPASAPARARGHRRDGRRAHRRRSVRGSAAAGPDGPRAEPRVRRRGGRVVPRFARALRAARRAARGGCPLRDPAGGLRRRVRGRRGGQPLCALHGREHPRRLRAGDRHDRGLRDPTDARRYGSRRHTRRLPASPSPLDRRTGRACRRAGRAGGRREAGAGSPLRERVSVSIRPGRPEGLGARPLSQRGDRRALGMAAGRGAHRRRVGHVPHRPAAARSHR